jgi:hypothetical protein
MSFDYEIIEGDNLPLIKVKVSSFSTLDENWVGKLFVTKSSDPDTHLITKNSLNKNSTDEYFEAFLTPAETASLGEGQFNLIIQLSNSVLTPVEFKTTSKKTLKINPSLV